MLEYVLDETHRLPVRPRERIAVCYRRQLEEIAQEHDLDAAKDLIWVWSTNASSQNEVDVVQQLRSDHTDFVNDNEAGEATRLAPAKETGVVTAVLLVLGVEGVEMAWSRADGPSD